MPEDRDLSGVVQSGKGLGAGLMADRTAMEKLEELGGFQVVPGTLNVRLPQPLERGGSWRYLAAEEIAPDWLARTGQSGRASCRERVEVTGGGGGVKEKVVRR